MFDDVVFQDESEEESEDEDTTNELLGRGARGALLKEKTRVRVLVNMFSIFS